MMNRFVTAVLLVLVAGLASCKSKSPTEPTPEAAATWERASPDISRNINVLATNGTRLLVGTAGFGVYHTDDQGQNMVGPIGAGGNVTTLVQRGAVVFALVEDGVIRSTDTGDNWSFTADPPGSFVNPAALADLNGTLFLGSVGYGAYRSSDNGAHWYASSPANKNVDAFAVRGNELWAAMNGSLAGATLADGVQASTDDGGTWYDHSPGLPTPRDVVNLYIIGADRVFARTSSGAVYFHDVYGFQPMTSALTNAAGLSIAVSGLNVFAAMPGKGVYRSSDGGVNWAAINASGLPSLDVHGIAVMGTTLFVSVGSGLWKSSIN